MTFKLRPTIKKSQHFYYSSVDNNPKFTEIDRNGSKGLFGIKATVVGCLIKNRAYQQISSLYLLKIRYSHGVFCEIYENLRS